MKKSLSNSQFSLHFDTEGTVRSFVATSLQRKTRKQSPSDSEELSSPHSTFQIFQEQPAGMQVYREIPEGVCSVAQEWTADKDSMGGVARLTLKKGAAERGVRVRWTFPHPFLPRQEEGTRYSRWKVWAAHLNAPFLNDWGHLVFTHGRCPDVATEIVLPSVTLFNAEADVGFTFLLDQEIPWVTRIELDQRRRLLAFEFFYMGLRVGQTAEIALRIFCHRGCWRPGLAAVQKRFPKAFRPLSKKSRAHEGPMAYTLAGPTEPLKIWRDKMGLAFNEILHFDDFGEYVPSEPWNCRNFWSPEAPWRKVDGLTWNRLRDYVRRCKDLGVGAYIYINFGDCESRLARRKYPEAILRDEWGKEIRTWVYPDKKRYCLMMNPDPQFGFSPAILGQAEELIERLPELDGFHYDQSAYGWIDTAHDDGVTWLGDRPAYNMLRAYRRVGRLFRELCDRHGKIVEANGIINFRQLEDADMLMAETSLSALARYGPLCSQRALIYLATGEQGFQWSLRYGAFPHVAPYEWAPQPNMRIEKKLAALYQAYLPINTMLRGATWVLEPNCLTLPRLQEQENCPGDVIGNFYRLAEGGWLVPLLQPPRSVLDTGAETGTFAHHAGLPDEEIRNGFPAILRFAAAKSVKKIQLLRPGQKPVAVSWTRKGNALEITVPQMGVCAALHLTA